MEHKNDFIEREVQKITLFLRNVIAKIVNGGNPSIVLKSFNRELKGKLDFGFYELLELSEEDLKNKIDGVDFIILEDLIKVFYEFEKEELLTKDANKLKKVSLFIINHIENKSLVFSFERQQIKNYFKSKIVNK